MRRFLEGVARPDAPRPVVWRDADGRAPGESIPRSGVLAVLAPHPDDPESVAVTCRLLARRGVAVHFAICTLSPEGVDDEYARAHARPSPDAKAAIRRREQERAAALFGLAPGHLTFLGLASAADLDAPEGGARIAEYLLRVAPDLVVLPAGDDANRTHRRVHAAFRALAPGLAAQLGKPVGGLYNEDPKTTAIRPDLLVVFGEATAAWKRPLLAAHGSQQDRNLRTRGIGLDERILATNRLRYARHADALGAPGPSAGYAECFEVEAFGIR